MRRGIPRFSKSSGVFGHHGLVCYRVSGRGAGTNYILSRNFFGFVGFIGFTVFLLNGSCTNGSGRRFFGRRVG